MRDLPTKDAEMGTACTVADFLEAGRERLSLSVIVGGRGLRRKIYEPIVNRPGLALAGFYAHFPWRRVQVFGNAEFAYVRSMTRDLRVARLREMIRRRASVFVFTAGHRPSAAAQALAAEKGVVMLASPLTTRDFAYQSTVILGELNAPRTALYGTMVEVSGLGVFLEGAAGLGKSETALGLLKRGAALVADDLTCIRKDVATNSLFASACDSTAGYMEIRGIGIVKVPRIFGIDAVRGEKRLELVVTFKRLKDIKGEVDRIGGQPRLVRTILGVDIPNIVLPVSEGRDLVNMVETAAQQHKLISTGYNPVAELSARLRQAHQAKSQHRKGKRNG